MFGQQVNDLSVRSLLKVVNNVNFVFIGGVFSIASLCQLFGTNVLYKLTYKFGRWQSSVAALLCKCVAFLIVSVAIKAINTVQMPLTTGFITLACLMVIIGASKGCVKFVR